MVTPYENGLNKNIWELLQINNLYINLALQIGGCLKQQQYLKHPAIKCTRLIIYTISTNQIVPQAVCNRNNPPHIYN